MKKIEFAKSFEKSYAKRIVRDGKLRQAYAGRYKLFASGKRDYPLDDQLLIGNLKGRRAFSVANDIRVIYRETDEAIIFLDIGTHAQVYE